MRRAKLNYLRERKGKAARIKRVEVFETAGRGCNRKNKRKLVTEFWPAPVPPVRAFFVSACAAECPRAMPLQILRTNRNLSSVNSFREAVC